MESGGLSRKCWCWDYRPIVCYKLWKCIRQLFWVYDPAHPSEWHHYWNFQHFWSQHPCHSCRAQLGSAVDSWISMKAHVNQICHASYVYISNISAIHRMLTKEATEALVHVFKSSQLDYCNFLYGLPASTLNKLQLIQNHATRVVTGTCKYDRITPVLRELYWLLVSQCIIFKLLTLTYQAVHGQAPVCLCELAVCYRPGHALHSADDSICLAEPGTHSKYRDCSFTVAGTSLWNDLPLSMREAESVHSFKRQLKTVLWADIWTVIWTFSWVDQMLGTDILSMSNTTGF